MSHHVQTSTLNGLKLTFNSQTMKHLEENTNSKKLGWAVILLDLTPKAQIMTAKTRNGMASDCKASERKKKQSTECRDNPQDKTEHLQIIHQMID